MDRLAFLLIGAISAIFLIIVCCLSYVIYTTVANYGSTIPDAPPAGAVFEEPLQQPCGLPTIYKTCNGIKYELETVAMYNITATVVRKMSYSDSMSALIPVDMALIWGKLDDPEFIDYVTYRQDDRAYFYSYPSGYPLGGTYIATHSANTHIIPENEQVMNALGSCPAGAQVTMGGYLVDAYWTGGGSLYWWKTSRTRTDTGMGSCELFYVDCITIGNTTIT